MGLEITEHSLADLLPGEWALAASNSPLSISGERNNATISYELATSSPLVLSELFEYTSGDGSVRQLAGTNTWRDGEFVWRGKGRMRFAPRRWKVTGTAEDGTIVVLRFDKSLAAQSGLDVLVREGHAHPELRRMVAHETERFGLSSEDFASLTWLNQSTWHVAPPRSADLRSSRRKDRPVRSR